MHDTQISSSEFGVNGVEVDLGLAWARRIFLLAKRHHDEAEGLKGHHTLSPNEVSFEYADQNWPLAHVGQARWASQSTGRKRSRNLKPIVIQSSFSLDTLLR
jgi:hypothetical protein